MIINTIHMIKIIENRKIFLRLSSILVGFSILSLLIFGLRLGVDFSGGSILEIRFNEVRPEIEIVKNRLSEIGLEDLSLKPVDENGIILKFKNTSEETHQEIISKLRNSTESAKNIESNVEENGDATTHSVIGEFVELSYDSVGPSIGEELKSKSLGAIFWVLIAIVLFVAWAFRKVSKPISSWKYGIVSIVALFHDVLILCGVFSVLGVLFEIEVNASFVVALLTILGYSVNDSIVVFDRLRENLPKSNNDFSDIVNDSVNQAITRSVNTSLTTLLVLGCIFVWGGETIRSFVLALMVGVGVGTYSSIFLASPLLVVWERYKK